MCHSSVPDNTYYEIELRGSWRTTGIENREICKTSHWWYEKENIL